MLLNRKYGTKYKSPGLTLFSGGIIAPSRPMILSCECTINSSSWRAKTASWEEASSGINIYNFSGIIARNLFWVTDFIYMCNTEKCSSKLEYVTDVTIHIHRNYTVIQAFFKKILQILISRIHAEEMFHGHWL